MPLLIVRVWLNFKQPKKITVSVNSIKIILVPGKLPGIFVVKDVVKVYFCKFVWLFASLAFMPCEHPVLIVGFELL